MDIFQIRLECREGSSNKFWEGRIYQNSDSTAGNKYVFLAHYGRIGQSGQSTDHPAPACFCAFDALRKKVNEKLKKGYVLANASVSAWRPGKFEYDLKVAFSRFLAAVKLDSTRIRDIKELARKNNWELSHSPTAGKVVKKGRIPTRISIMASDETEPEKPSTAPEKPSTRLKTILEYRKKAAKISI